MISRILQRRSNGAATAGPSGVEARVLHADAIRLRHSQVFSAQRTADCCRFLERVFAVDEVRHVDIDQREGTADIFFDRSRVPLPQSIQRVSRTLASDSEQAGRTTGATEHLFLRRQRPDTIRVRRYGNVVTTWELMHQLPGRVRLRHDVLLRRKLLADYVQHELEATFGVLAVKVRPLTGTVLISLNEHVVTLAQLLRIVEGILHDAHQSRPPGYQHPATKMALANTALGLAAIADTLVPLLLPASAALLVLSNLETLRAAWRELRQRRLGVASLYTTIIAVTLASGYFFTAALMAWFMIFWDRKYHRRLTAAQRTLLADFRRQPRYVWLRRQGIEYETPIEALRCGHVVSLRTGELVPVDGVVVAGEATVDERLVRGHQGLSDKAPGDRVFASSLVFAGSLQVKVVRVGHRTRAATISQMIEKASTPPPEPLKVRGESFARRTVLPTLATAGAGWLAGDLGTAAAILRPDYATGPGMCVPLGTLQDLKRATEVGIVVRNAEVFEKFARVDLLLFDLPSAGACLAPWEAETSRRNGQRVGPATARSRRPRRGRIEVGLMGNATPASTQRYARQLGADFFHHGLAADEKANLIRSFRQRDRQVAYIGDCLKSPEVAQQAYVSVSLGEILQHADDPADAFLVGKDLVGIIQLTEIARFRQRRRRAHYSWTMMPNLFCVAGAFTLGFTSMASVLITNLGVLTVYRSGTRWLRNQKRTDVNKAEVLAEAYRGGMVREARFTHEEG